MADGPSVASAVGWAYKRQRLRQNWLSRWFFVEHGNLFYNKAGGAVKRKLSIAGATVKLGHVIPGPGKLTLYLLTVFTSEQGVAWTVGLPSAAERLHWIASFERAAGYGCTMDYSSEIADIRLPDELCEGAIPSFGSSLSVHSCAALPCPLPRAQSLRRILCVLSQEFSDMISLCPALADCVLLLLNADTEVGAYTRAKALLRNSLQGRWFLSFRQYSITDAFAMRLRETLPGVAECLTSFGLTPQTVFGPWIDCLFSFLPRPVHSTLFQRFLDEGAGVWLQVGLSALNLHYQLSLGWPFVGAQEFCSNLSSAMQLMGPFALLDPKMEVMAPDLNALLHQTTPVISQYRHRPFRMPEIETPSCFLSPTDWLCLMSWLPPTAQPRLLFSTQEHGYSMEALLLRVKKQPHLLIVQARRPSENDRELNEEKAVSACEIFGCFVATRWVDNNSNPGECFVFSLRPPVQYAGSKLVASESAMLIPLPAAPPPYSPSISLVDSSYSPSSSSNSSYVFPSGPVTPVSNGRDVDGGSYSSVLKAQSPAAGVYSIVDSEPSMLPPFSQHPTLPRSLCENRILMHVRAYAISIGGPAGAFALSLDSKLRTGFSHASKAFMSPSLCSDPSGHFDCLAVECWSI